MTANLKHFIYFTITHRNRWPDSVSRTCQRLQKKRRDVVLNSSTTKRIYPDRVEAVIATCPL